MNGDKQNTYLLADTLSAMVEEVTPEFRSVLEDQKVRRKAMQHLALQVADAASTLGLLSVGGKEINPLLNLFPNHPVASVVAPKVAALVLGKKELEKMPIEEKEKVKKGLNALNLLYMVLVANNVYQLSKSRK